MYGLMGSLLIILFNKCAHFAERSVDGARKPQRAQRRLRQNRPDSPEFGQGQARCRKRAALDQSIVETYNDRWHRCQQETERSHSPRGESAACRKRARRSERRGQRKIRQIHGGPVQAGSGRVRALQLLFGLHQVPEEVPQAGAQATRHSHT